MTDNEFQSFLKGLSEAATLCRSMAGKNSSRYGAAIERRRTTHALKRDTIKRIAESNRKGKLKLLGIRDLPHAARHDHQLTVEGLKPVTQKGKADASPVGLMRLFQFARIAVLKSRNVVNGKLGKPEAYSPGAQELSYFRVSRY